MDATYIDLTIRLSLALLLGGAIGIEREYRAKEAGFRTHFLVALGSALFCVVSQYPDRMSGTHTCHFRIDVFCFDNAFLIILVYD